MKFFQVNAVRIPEGAVRKIRADGDVLWTPIQARYVSLGDSIAAGHTINDEWATNYGEGSQYGKNGNTETAIVPGSYTDLIRDDLTAMYGGRVLATSFARSGDRVDDLMEKLDHAVVRNAIAKAKYVTICIGANDVLEPAMSHLDEYINTGDLSPLATIVEANLAVLADDTNPNSYKALFDKMAAINPNAKYVFTTIYNPYKHLWIEGGHYGFFKPVLQSIPTMEFMGIDFDSFIKDSLLGMPAVDMLFDRVNGLGDWAEKYVTMLNNVLRSKINAYDNDNFLLADAKAVYDPVPDRPIAADKHYNDLVSVEYTRDYDTAQMDWGRLWEGSDAGSFWWGLAEDHGLDLEGLASDLVQQMIEKVIVPDIDPHPEWYGHHALHQSFADALGWTNLTRHTISYNANDGTGRMSSQTVVALDNMTAYTNLNANAFTPVKEGDHFNGWIDGNGAAYTDGQLIGLSSDLVMNAQWSDMYIVRFRHSKDSNFHGSGDTGPMEKYAFWIDGTEQADLGAFSNDARIYYLPYGTPLGVIAQTALGSARSYITVNGTTVAGKSDDARWGFNLTGHTDIKFEWNYWLDGVIPQSYWNCYITTY